MDFGSVEALKKAMVDKGAEATPEEVALIAAYLKKALPETPA